MTDIHQRPFIPAPPAAGYADEAVVGAFGGGDDAVGMSEGGPGRGGGGGAVGVVAGGRGEMGGDCVEGWGDRMGEYGARMVGRKRRHEGDVPYPFTVWGFGIEFLAHVAASELAEGAGLDLESAQSGVESWEEAGCWGLSVEW